MGKLKFLSDFFLLDQYVQLQIWAFILIIRLVWSSIKISILKTKIIRNTCMIVRFYFYLTVSSFVFVIVTLQGLFLATYLVLFPGWPKKSCLEFCILWFWFVIYLLTKQSKPLSECLKNSSFSCRAWANYRYVHIAHCCFQLRSGF